MFERHSVPAIPRRVAAYPFSVWHVGGIRPSDFEAARGREVTDT